MVARVLFLHLQVQHSSVFVTISVSGDKSTAFCAAGET